MGSASGNSGTHESVFPKKGVVISSEIGRTHWLPRKNSTHCAKQSSIYLDGNIAALPKSRAIPQLLGKGRFVHLMVDINIFSAV